MIFPLTAVDLADIQTLAETADAWERRMLQLRRAGDDAAADDAELEVAELRAAIRAVGRPEPGIIADGYGSEWNAECPDCGRLMQVVRPGKAQCPRCG